GTLRRSRAEEGPLRIGRQEEGHLREGEGHLPLTAASPPRAVRAAGTVLAGAGRRAMSDFNDQAEPQRGNPRDEEPVPAEPEAHDVHPDDAAHRRTEAQLQRAVADLANLRKRTHRDIDDARRRMVEAMSADLLPVLDNFHLALGAQD